MVMDWQLLAAAVGIIAVLIGGLWKIFDGRITALERSIITRDVHDEAFKRVDQYMQSSDSRFDRIEDTRPTVETLNSVAAGAKDTVKQLEERVRSLENAPRAPRGLTNK